MRQPMLNQRQERKLKALSKETGWTVEELVRKAVDYFYDFPPLPLPKKKIKKEHNRTKTKDEQIVEDKES